MAVKDGRLLEGPPGRGPFVGFEAQIEQVQRPAKGPKNVRFATPQQHSTAGPRLNSVAVKDGRLLEGLPGRGRFTVFETPIDKVQRPAKGLKNARFATPKQHGIAGQIVPSKGSWSWRRQLLNCLPMKKNRPVLMLRCLGRLPLQWQRQGSADIHSYIKVYIYICIYIYMYIYMYIYIFMYEGI